MKSEKLTNTLLALIFLALLAHLVVPLLLAHEVSAAGRDALAPSAVASDAGFPALDKIASEVGSGLDGIAKSNQQIADAIKEHARSNAQIARSLKDVASGVQGLELRTPATASSPVSKPRSRPEPDEAESDPDWWKKYLDE
jgi:hypothetical protein